MATNYTQKELQTVESFFTDDEWNAIDSALSDYQDYGEDEAALADTIGDKIYLLFKQLKEVN
tara:strand:- start:508 stop:693 length:186 start_codon:yes stop_codon:yes gene_type:complete